MDNPGHRRRPLSLAEKIGFGAFICALLAMPLDVRLTILPLSAFLLLCFAAPFFPGFSFFLPIISKGRRDQPAVSLTFDDGPDPASTPLLLDLLDRYGAKATFFVPGQKAARHPQLIREILARGHTIGNHSYSHDIFMMFRSHRFLVREILAAQQVYRPFGIVPLAFRPPVGITNPRLPAALSETGLFIVNFSRRACDGGNRRVRHLADRILKRLRGGDIIMLHDVPPTDRKLLEFWREQVEAILSGIQHRGIAILPLGELIGRPVMRSSGG